MKNTEKTVYMILRNTVLLIVVFFRW